MPKPGTNTPAVPPHITVTQQLLRSRKSRLWLWSRSATNNALVLHDYHCRVAFREAIAKMSRGEQLEFIKSYLEHQREKNDDIRASLDDLTETLLRTLTGAYSTRAETDELRNLMTFCFFLATLKEQRLGIPPSLLA